MPIYKKINKDFFKKWSRDMAYVLGFFAADGNISHNNRGASFLSIEITDKKLLYSIRKAMSSDHTISVRNRGGLNKDSYRLQIGSKEMVEDLAALGFKSRKAYALSVPDMPKKYRADFIRGYFDGDGNVWTGYVHKERKTALFVIQVLFTSASREFLFSLQSLLHEEGLVGGSLTTHAVKKYSRLSFVGSDSLKIFKIMYNTETPLYLKRKKDVFERFISNMRP
jgi:intein/homing endonuclease